MQLTNGAITKSATPPPPAVLAKQLAAQELEGVDLETVDQGEFFFNDVNLIDLKDDQKTS